MIKIHHGDAKSIPYPDDHFDGLFTDPPYGYGFMGKDWDRALVGVAIWKEILRVMKPGTFGFIMSAPRQDVLSRMIINLQDAGFETGFTSIYWTYATGMPKAQNISKAVDKRLGVERKSLGPHPNARKTLGTVQICKKDGDGQLRPIPATPEAAALDGAYAGFQPKPAVEVILVVMKPLSKKTYLDQAMKDGKGVTWLEPGRIPYSSEADVQETENKNRHADFGSGPRENKVYGEDKRTRAEQGNYSSAQGRFPANLLVSDEVLDDGRVTKSSEGKSGHDGAYSGGWKESHYGGAKPGLGGAGDFSRYFSLDAWWEERVRAVLDKIDKFLNLPEPVRRTYPFLIVPKASKAEKNRGCKAIDNETYLDESRHDKEAIGCNNPRNRSGKARKGNIHPTVKPVKLMSYLIAIGSRPGDIILDPFMGSGTTLVAALVMGRRAVGMDNDAGCIPIAEARVKAVSGGLF